jgi:tetratricopeptide (TPR) repeat protein
MMRFLQITLVLFSGLLSQFEISAQSRVTNSSATTAAKTQLDTPAIMRIAAAKKELAADPAKAQAYNELAIGFMQRERETADHSYLKDADAALAQGMKLDPADFQLQKTQVALLLSRHRFVEAKDLASALNHSTPDDVMTYGYLAEADLALGNYAEAEANAQWMMNLRPNNTPALLIGAKLRVLFGDASGAIAFLNQAYTQTSPIEVEELAWIANQIASIQVEAGQVDSAEKTLTRAEELFAGYPYTLENLARVRMAENRATDAAQLLARAVAADRDPHVLYLLAAAQRAAGQADAAAATLVEFEPLAGQDATSNEQSKLDLILADAEKPATAQAALTVAQGEFAERKDVWTLDAYAWALYANAKYEEANVQIQKALAVGIRSAQIFDHAGHIAQRLNRSEEARKLFILATQANPTSEFALDAQRAAGLSSVAMARDPAPVAADSESGVSHGGDRDGRGNASVSVEGGVALPMNPSATNASVIAPVPSSLLAPEPTETARLLERAQTVAVRNTKDAAAYAGLGAAYFQRARETGDVSDYQHAEESLTKSLDLVSVDFSSETAFETMAEVCMGEHRFTDALAYAHKALSLGTGDVSPFAIVGDAYADMGEYDKAAEAYGRLTPRDMTLSPRAAYARDSRLAYLKFISGDTAEAIRLMHASMLEGVEAQLPKENLAWLYYELGEFESQGGDAFSANAAYLEALNTHPGDYRALAGLAKLRAGLGRYAEATVLYQKAIAVVPMPIFIAELGDLYAKTGDAHNAQKQFALVEYIGMLGHINQVLHNRDLAQFYADHDVKLTEALDLAQKELEVRHDVYTWDALAWALLKNGKLTDAADASAKALKFGTKDSMLLFHAGMIAAALGQREQAQSRLKQALEINPHFHPMYASVAQNKVTELESQAKVMGGPNEHAR